MCEKGIQLVLSLLRIFLQGIWPCSTLAPSLFFLALLDSSTAWAGESCSNQYG